MPYKTTISNSILTQKILPLYSHSSIEVMKHVITACYHAGITCFEFTNRTENAVAIFNEMKDYCKTKMPDLMMGVGTILNIRDAEAFSNADFLVSPIISVELIHYTSEKNILWIPGCSTASEIALAKNAGINLVKIFPAHLLGGTTFLKTMKDIFPEIKFLATGGIKAERDDINNWLNNGADAVGLGSQLFGKEIKDIQQISETLKQLLKGI